MTVVRPSKQALKSQQPPEPTFVQAPDGTGVTHSQGPASVMQDSIARRPDAPRGAARR